MCRKLIYLTSFVLVLGLLGEASADLIAHWPLDTDAKDIIGNHDGTLVGGAQFTNDPERNRVLSVDGVDGRVEIPHSEDLVFEPSDSFSITAWINIRTLPGNWAGVVTKSRDIEPWYGLWITPGNQMHFVGGEGGTNTRMDVGAARTGWLHFAGVYNADAQTQTVYVDGVVVAENTSVTIIASGAGDIWIGGAKSVTEFLDALFDDIRIYDHALTENELLGAMEGEPWPYAFGPSPEDEALLTEFVMGILGTTLTWKPGDLADTHDVYFGEDFDAVNDGTGDTFIVNQTSTFLYVGYGYMPEDPLPGGLVPGTTYYWRIDEVNDTEPNSPWKGNVWSFRIPPTKAYDPTPRDGSKFIDPNVDLSWEPGMGGVMQTVYFDEDYDAVDNGTIDGVPVGGAAYDPGSLEYDTTYYWRVETVGPTYGQIKGDVWSFKTTLPGLGTIVLERWNDFTGSVPDLRNFWKYPNNPDEVETLNQFSWNFVDLESYGARIYGWVYAPATGDYTFWLCSDDNGELWLSTNDDSSNTELIAQEGTWQNANVWGSGEERSDPIPLVAGNRYYIEALWEEDTGGDHCMVAWQGPGIEGPTIIPGNNLSPYEPLKAFGAKPANRATGVTQTPILEWKPGIQAASHELYFGTDEDVVRNATKASSEYIGPRALGDESYDPGELAWESTYYWRVDEVNNINPDSPWVGSVWSFTTAGYAIVDDFEDYNVTDNQIWAIWHDGIGYWDLLGIFHPGNGTGSGVGDEENDTSYMEESIVNSGGMSMPYFFNNNDPTKMKYSEAKLTLVDTRDWTEEGVKALSLWFQGYLASAGSFTDNFDGTYTMTVSGADITGQSDEFHFAYKTLNGAGSIIARVNSVQNTDAWAKAGVMIRDSLDPNSAHAMVFVTPGNGVVFEYRPSTGADNVGSAAVQSGITAPHWVKLDRDIVGNITASQSADGLTWEPLGIEQNIPMNIPLYIGLALSGNNTNATCQAEFSNVQVDVSGPWMHQDIGIQSNDPERVYVAISNSNGTTGTVYYEDNDNIVEDATQINTWTEFNIDLKDFQDQGVNLADVNSVAIGIGTRGSTTPGGEGKMYFDDIRLYRPRYVPGKGTPIASDFNADGVVDFRDVRILVSQWLYETQIQDWEHRVAYWDAAYTAVGWADIAVTEAVRDYLATNGYTVVNAAQLKTWMDARIADGAPSVVVFCIDHRRWSAKRRRVLYRHRAGYCCRDDGCYLHD
ncbi:MAG: LamG-like jellyroll fold domain-containing protein [Planctomycetota bacterium]